MGRLAYWVSKAGGKRAHLTRTHSEVRTVCGIIFRDRGEEWRAPGKLRKCEKCLDALKRARARYRKR